MNCGELWAAPSEDSPAQKVSTVRRNTDDTNNSHSTKCIFTMHSGTNAY